MRSGPDQNKLVLTVAVDRAPVTLDVTAAIGFPRSLQRMIVIDGRKRNASLKLFDDRDKLIHPVARLATRFRSFRYWVVIRRGFIPCDYYSSPRIRSKISLAEPL